MKSEKLKRERNETAGVIIERVGESVEVFFKPNKQGEHARKQWAKLNEPIRRG